MFSWPCFPRQAAHPREVTIRWHRGHNCTACSNSAGKVTPGTEFRCAIRAPRCSHPGDDTEPSGHPSNGHLYTVCTSSTVCSSSEDISSLRSTATERRFASGATRDEVEDGQCSRPLRASGVKRFVGRFLRFPRPNCALESSTCASCRLLTTLEDVDEEEEEEKEDVQEEEDVASMANARAFISSGDIHLVEDGAAEVEELEGTGWAPPAELCPSAVGRA